MKFTKLMLSAFVAAMALVSCNKEAHTPDDGSLKTVEISFENILMTKGPAGEKINAGDKVTVNNIKIFLTDGSYSPSYEAKDLEGKDAKVAYDLVTDGNILNTKLQFHYVSHKCNRVVVVANVPNIETMSITDVKNLTKNIDDQQDAKNLVLIADVPLQNTGKYNVEHTDQQTELWEAKLTLKPAISRFEVDGFRVNFNDDTEFSKIQVAAIGFQNYYPSVNVGLNGGNALSFYGTGSPQHINMDNDSEVYNWFNTISASQWYVDEFKDDNVVELTKTNPVKDIEPLAYHFFAGNVIPTMVIKLYADSYPAYIYAEEFSSGNNTVNTLEAGKIYRMSGQCVADGSTGAIIIPDDLDPIQRCLDIQVTVHDWVVELVAPQF